MNNSHWALGGKLSSSSRSLIDEERDFGCIKSEVHKTIFLMHGVTAEALTEKNVPVGFPLVVHVLLHSFGNFNSVFLEVQLIKSF